MSWHFSQVLVAEYLERSSSGGELSAGLRSNPTPQAFLSPDRMKAFSRRSLSGMTFALLTENLGVGLLTWFLEGFPVRILVPSQQQKEKDLMEKKADCGLNLQESFSTYNQSSSSWKTHQGSSPMALVEFLGRWPKWGTMRNGVCSAAPISELGIKENEFGFSVPTIGKNEYKGCSQKRFRGSPAYRGAKMSEGLRTSATDPMYTHPNFAEQAMGWPITWTELRPLETDKFQQWQRAHGISC